MTFDKRLMDLFLVTRSSLCPYCGHFWYYDIGPMHWSGESHSKHCRLCSNSFRMYAKQGRVYRIEEGPWSAT